MTPDSSPEQLEQLHYWAVTLDGQAPGADGQFNAAGWPAVDRDFAIAQALDIAMRRHQRHAGVSPCRSHDQERLGARRESDRQL